MWQVYLHKRALKFLSKRTPDDKQRLLEKIKLLEKYPDPRLDVKKLTGETDSYRIRVGDYRIIFFVNADKKEILVDDIDNRGQVYK